jgi:hypothetical protein
MSDINELLMQIRANPKFVEAARAIARDHAEEIKRILVEDGDDPVESM